MWRSSVKTVFPSIYTLLQISVTLPVSSCNVERSFSKLKLVKTKLRSTMTEDRLENLIIITCEQDQTLKELYSTFQQKVLYYQNL